MSRTYDGIDDALREWIAAQPMYFVGTAPLAADGHVNCSPKGGDTLRVLGPREVAYLDGMGSGVETIAHLRENGRIVVMLCAFDGSPRIVRLHGRGEVVDARHPEFAGLLARFDGYVTARAVIRVRVDRVSESCGYGVPLMDFRAHRRESAQYVAKASDRALVSYLQDHNRQSVDGLPGLDPAAIDRLVIRRP
jgi:predicted pyridoxine 5'-phosphate oxidase superfamily flavin-nucleotide-binding protein